VLSLRPRIFEYIFDECIGRTCSIIFNINFVNIFDIKFNWMLRTEIFNTSSVRK
jgi:hypothetical protein